MTSEFWNDLQLVDKVGEGNFGAVYKAIAKNGQTFAVKHIILPREPQEIEFLLQNGLIKDRSEANQYYANIMKKEMEVMAKFNGNPYIVNFYDFYQKNAQNGIRADYYIKMEYVNDITKIFSNKSVDVNEVVKLGIDICHALELCSSINIIHNDIKPQNIFFGNDGKYKLGDFNISLEKFDKPNNFGTLNYITPEMYTSRNVNSSTDLYSLGLVMYKLINGDIPFKTKNTSFKEAFDLRMSGKPVPIIEGLDINLMKILSKACSYNENERYKSAIELREDLEKLSHIDFKSKVIVFFKNEVESTVGIYDSNNILNKSKKNINFSEKIKLIFNLNNIKKILKVTVVLLIILLVGRNFALKRSCDVGYINKNGSCVKGYYFCESGYSLNSDNKCQKTIESEDAKVSYTCKSGYTLSGESCVSNDVKEVEFVHKCADGFTLNGQKCERVESVDAVVTYSCPNEYVAAGGQCVKVSNVDATIKNSCEDSSYTLSGSTCTKTVSKTVNPIQNYTCDANGVLKETVCEYTVDATNFWPYNRPSCSKGEYNYLDRKCHYTENAKVTNVCSNGVLDGNGKCVYNETISVAATQKYVCPSGYTSVGNQCAKTMGVPATAKYICADGASLKGTKCYKTISTDAVGMYACPDGYVASGSSCYKDDFVSAIKKYTCSRVYTLKGDKCEKYKTVEPNVHYNE